MSVGGGCVCGSGLIPDGCLAESDHHLGGCVHQTESDLIHDDGCVGKSDHHLV